MAQNRFDQLFSSLNEFGRMHIEHKKSDFHLPFWRPNPNQMFELYQWIEADT